MISTDKVDERTQPMLNSSLWSNLKRLLKIRHIITNILKTWTTINLFPFGSLLNRAEAGETISSIKLSDAGRYASNAKGDMLINTDIFFSSRVYAYRADDRLVKIGKKTLMSMSCAGNSNGSSVKDPPSFA